MSGSEDIYAVGGGVMRQPGVVYILTNPGLREGWFKIGCSTLSGASRAEALNRDANTGTPGLFECIFECLTHDCGTAEIQVFELLAAQRRGKRGQEFFEIPAGEARVIIERTCERVDQSLGLVPRQSLARPMPPRRVFEEQRYCGFCCRKVVPLPDEHCPKCEKSLSNSIVLA